MPNDRIVRSCTSPVVGSTASDSVAHPAERHVRGADRVGAQHRSRRADRRPRRGPRLRSSAPVRIECTRAPALAPDGATRRCRATSVVGERDAVDAAASSAPSTSTACSASPTARSVDARPAVPRRRPPASVARTSSRTASAITRVTADATARDDTVDLDDAVAPHRGRRDRRALGSEPHDVFARVDDAHRRARTGRRARAPPPARPNATLPPNAPPFASGDAGSPPGAHHDASGSRYAGSTHDVARRTPPGGHARHAIEQRRPLVDRRAPALHLAGRVPRPRAATRRRPNAARPRRPRRPPSRAGAGPRRARRGARCRRRTARRRAGRRRRRAADRRLRARRAAPRPRRRSRGRVGGRAARPRRAPSASPCTGTGARRAHGRRRGYAAPDEPHDDARACRTRTAIRRSRRTRRPVDRASAGSSPSTVVTDRPATRATGVTHATRGSPSTSTVQQPHCPCGAQPSLAERMPSRSRST